MDIAEVETELVSNLWWITFSFSLWISLQAGEPIRNIFPSPALSKLFPVASTSSAVIRLDEISENLSTLQMQKQSAQEMWPLANICSIIANLSSNHDLEAESCITPCNIPWEASMLDALHRVSNFRNHNAKTGNTKAYSLIEESIGSVTAEAENCPSKDAVLAVQHALTIHLLFPRQVVRACNDISSFRLSADVLEQLFLSVAALLEAFDAERGQLSLDHDRTHRQRTHQYMYMLGLDTCTRALDLIQIAAGFDASLNSINLVQIYAEKLVSLTSGLLESARHQVHHGGVEFRGRQEETEGATAILQPDTHEKAVVQFPNPSNIPTSRNPLPKRAQSAGTIAVIPAQ